MNKPEPVAWMGASGRVISAKQKHDYTCPPEQRDFVPVDSHDFLMDQAKQAALTYSIPLYGPDLMEAYLREKERGDGLDGTVRTFAKEIEYQTNRAENAEAAGAALREIIDKAEDAMAKGVALHRGNTDYPGDHCRCDSCQWLNDWLLIKSRAAIKEQP